MLRCGEILLAALLLMTLVRGSCSAAEYVTISGDQFRFNGQVVKLKGTNYYPRDGMWAGIWNNWDPARVRQDAALVAGLGMNCVRILVPYTSGGWGGANPPESRLQMLEELVNVFGDNGVRSCVTLFDWETSFAAQGTQRETEHLSYLSKIVNRLKDNEYVLMWDVKNEPDHPNNIGGFDNWDNNPAQRDKIVSWLNRMCAAVRAIDSHHPVSAGLRWWQNISDVTGFVDVAICHSYWPNVTQQIADARSYMGSAQKPIVFEEFGWPSNPNPCNRDGQVITDYNETKQLELYTMHLTAFAAQNIAGCMQWMTFDEKPYTSNPDDSFERYFGLWKYDYSLKPAGVYYRDHFPVTLFPPRDGAPAPVSQFIAVPSGSAIRLSWVNPSDADFARTVIRCSTSNPPTAPTGGTAVCDRAATPGSTDSFVHENLQPGLTYYYSAFAFDAPGSHSVGVSATGSANARSLSQIRTLPDNTSITFSGAVVTGVFANDGCIYVEDIERVAGIRVAVVGDGVQVGDRVDIAGRVTSRMVNNCLCEREISSASVNKIASGEPLEPWALGCLSVGGGPAGALVPGVKDGIGLNNIGLLVKITGKVTCEINNNLWVDDGSGIPDIYGRKGGVVRCDFDNGVSAGDTVSCVGVIEGNIPIGWTTNRRCLHARSVADIVRRAPLQ